VAGRGSIRTSLEGGEEATDSILTIFRRAAS